MTIRKIFIVIIAVMALFVGGMIYIVFRPESILMFKWFPFLGIIHNQICVSDSFIYPDFLVYSLPDGLWIFSYILLIGAIWNFSFQRCGFLIMLLPIYAISYEVLQLYQLVPGYFDILDILVYAAATLAGISVLLLSDHVYKIIIKCYE